MSNLKTVIGYLYALSMNDVSFEFGPVDKQGLYESFRDGGVLRKNRLFASNKSYDVFMSVHIQAVRYAIKVALDIYSSEGSLDAVTNEQIQEAIKETREQCYIGKGTDSEWSKMCDKSIPCLFDLEYNPHEKVLTVFRSIYKILNCYIFEFNKDVINGIWGNLLFELYYATNDDDERYSIQTHKLFLRNIIIEMAEEPLGYAPFYSGPLDLYY